MTPPAASWWRALVVGGSRHVPRARWSAGSRWSARPTTLLVLVVGLALFGIGEGALVAAGLGVSPWTVLAQGLSARTGLGIGATTALVSTAVLLAWWPLRERPGLGTVANIIVIAAFLGWSAPRWPTPSAAWAALLQVVAGIAIVGLGGALYLSTHLGPGPRDGLMTGLHQRFGLPVAGVRLGLEVSALTAGWLLGGTVGIGTVLFALLVGRLLAAWLGVVGRLAPEDVDEDPSIIEERGD